MKPSFVAPSQTLEKSLKEQMALSSSTSPKKSSSPARSEASASSSSLASNPSPLSLSITDEEKEKRTSGSASSSFSLEGKPFLESVFSALNSEENDYLTLYALCLLYAMQQNAGE